MITTVDAMTDMPAVVIEEVDPHDPRLIVGSYASDWVYARCDWCRDAVRTVHRRAIGHHLRCSECRAVRRHKVLDLPLMMDRLLWSAACIRRIADVHIDEGLRQSVTWRQYTPGPPAAALDYHRDRSFALTLHPDLAPWAQYSVLSWAWEDIANADKWDKPGEQWKYRARETDLEPVPLWDCARPQEYADLLLEGTN